jgi:hypothetical protein
MPHVNFKSARPKNKQKTIDCGGVGRITFIIWKDLENNREYIVGCPLKAGLV